MKFWFITLIFFTCVITVAQPNISVHQYHSEVYRKNLPSEEIKIQKTQEIIPLDTNVVKGLTKSVFGYYPDWEYQANAHQYFDYDLLTHIAAFDFQVNANGQLTEPWNWPWTDFINSAHAAGVKIIMVVTNFDDEQIHSLMTNSFSRWAFMIGVQNKIKKYVLDGVNIDFEGMKVDDRGSLLNEFMQELSDSVHSIDPNLEVSFAAPAVNWGGWNLTGLANSCDYLFVMGYDFYGSWSTTTGPTAPLVSSSNYNVTNTITKEYATVTTFYPEKLILGVPYYGPHWSTATASEGSSVIDFIGSERFRTAQPLAESKGLKWSTNFKNSWISYTESGENHQIWFDNDSSLGLKLDLAISRKLKGVGMWALGYDGTRTELWNLIEDKFAIPVGVKDENRTFTNELELKQNYPNPFNPTTIISYSIPKSISEFNQNRVTLKIYDILGREVATLVNGNKSPGNYEVRFDASNLPSGIYIYRIQADQYSLTKKMTLIK